MSKAFTREDDTGRDEAPLRVREPVVPPGVPNYLTVEGEQRLRRELEHLRNGLRPEALAIALDDARERALREIDPRIEALAAKLEGAEVVHPPERDRDYVRFGATVVLSDTSGESRTYRVVGAGEADPANGLVSWLSPLGKALLGAREGDDVTVPSPRGRQRYEVREVRYEPAVLA